LALSYFIGFLLQAFKESSIGIFAPTTGIGSCICHNAFEHFV